MNSTLKIGSPVKEASVINRLQNHFSKCPLSPICESDTFDDKTRHKNALRTKSPRVHLSNSPPKHLSEQNSRHRNLAKCTEDVVPSLVDGTLHAERICRQLLQIEQKFVCCLRQGIVHFSRPCSHDFFSSSERQTLFQNVEELLSRSENHLRLLTLELTSSNKTLQSTCSRIGEIYQFQLSAFCDSYIAYCRGLSAASQLVTKLSGRQSFQTLRHRKFPGSPEVGLDTFLYAPQKHLQNLTCMLGKAVAAVEAQSEQFSTVMMVHQGKSRSTVSECTDYDLKSVCIVFAAAQSVDFRAFTFHLCPA